MLIQFSSTRAVHHRPYSPTADDASRVRGDEFVDVNRPPADFAPSLAAQRIGAPAICLVVTLMRFHTLIFAIASTSAPNAGGS
jgi:hypothetical protein